MPAYRRHYRGYYLTNNLLVYWDVLRSCLPPFLVAEATLCGPDHIAQGLC